MDNFKELIEELDKEAAVLNDGDVDPSDIASSITDKIDSIIKEKLGITLLDLKTAIGTYVKENPMKMAEQFVTMAPNGNWGLMMEDKVNIAKFMETEVYKPENWNISSINPSSNNKALLEFMFNCKAIDDGDVFRGYAYVSLSGKIRHVFAQGE